MNRRTFFRWALRAGVALVGLVVAERIKIVNKSLAQVDDNLYGPAGDPYPGPSNGMAYPPPSSSVEAYPCPAEHSHTGYPDAYPLLPDPVPTSTPKKGKGEKPRTAIREPRK